METAKLYNEHGQVAEVAVPVFRPRKELLQWHSRYFLHRKGGKYYEIQAFTVL